MADTPMDVNQEVLQVLLEKIEGDTYPSVTMMDMVELIIRDEDLPAYAEVLLDKIRADRFPSMDMLRRVMSLA